ncbi:MAG: fibronectin type III domain-containing protein, partial [Desulfobaccales bacterium]
MSKRSDRRPEVESPLFTRSRAKSAKRQPKTGAAAGYLLLSWSMALAILCGGCGKKLPPLAPDRLLPGPVREFRLSQEGDTLVLSWLLPRVNLLGQPLTQVQGCRVYRCEVRGVSPEAPCPMNFVRYADIDLAYPQQGEVRGDAFIFQDRELVPDHRYFYRVAAYDQDGYLGSWSPTLSRVWGWLPRPPLDLQAVLGDRLVALRWSPVSQLTNGSPARDLTGYLIYRREGSGAWSQISPEPLPQTAFQDVAVKNEVEYTYKVLAVRRLGGELLASADSPLVSARPEKLTPPPPLLDLLAVPTSQGVELRWQPSPAPDVAGYRVYRRAPGEARAGRLNPELLTKPYFVDSRGQRGQTYYYYVT